MGARQKLNAAYVNGCLLVAALVGLASQSWLLFWSTLVVAVVSCHHAGGIRHRPDARRAGRRR